MKQTINSLFLMVTGLLLAQNSIDWNGGYQLQLSDFHSPATQIGGVEVYSLHTAVTLEFSFQMSNAEFMFTKNFNSKVNCSFNKEAASIVAPDSLFAVDLLNFTRFDFDLTELYARKLRKKLFEEKGAFSDIKFIRPLYDQIQNELVKRQTLAARETDLGRRKEKLQELHQEVVQELELYMDFCKECKPPKKKKK